MKIYPKTSLQDMSEEMNEINRNSEGMELQFFHEKDIADEFNFENLIRQRKKEFPNLKEIIVHPPLSNYNIELLVFKNKELIAKQLTKLVELSKELNIKLCINYHTYWTKEQYRASGLADIIKEYLKIIENTDVIMLIENLYMILDEKDSCSVIDICKYIDHPNLRACIDTTHVHCKANIYKKDFNTMIHQEFNKEDCEKYVKQIHFAAALDNDGYIKKQTHGRKHESYESLKEELAWLEEYGMKDKIYVTEVSEEDYFTRVDQIEEIKMLQKAIQE